MDAQTKKLVLGICGGIIFATVALLAVYFGAIGPGNAAALRSARESVSVLTDDLSSALSEVQDLRDQLTANTRDLDRANAELAASAAELARLTDQLTATQARARDYATRLEDYRKRYEASIARNAELEVKLRELADRISEYFGILRDTIDSLSSADSAISNATAGLREIISIVQASLLDGAGAGAEAGGSSGGD